MKKLYSIITLILISLVSVTCFNKDGNESPQEDIKTTITIWERRIAKEASNQYLDQGLYDYKIESFKKKYPDIEVVEGIGRGSNEDYIRHYDKALMSGLAPSLIDIFSYTNIPSRINNGTIAEITELYNSWEEKGQMLDLFNDAISKDGKWYAVPRSAYIMGTFYNKKLIEEGGGDPEKLPETWDELIDICMQVSDNSIPRYGYSLVGNDACAWLFTAWIWSAGGEMVERNGDGTYKIRFNESPGVDVAQFWNKMAWKYKVTQKDFIQPYSLTASDIQTGRVCFGWIDMSYVDYKVMDCGYIPMPVKDKSIEKPYFMGGEVVTFNPSATKKELEAAWKYYLFTYFDEDFIKSQWNYAKANNIKVNDISMQIPAKPSMYKAKLDYYSVPPKIQEEMINAIDVAKIEPYCRNWNDLKLALSNTLQNILLNKNITKMEITDALNECAEQLYTEYPNSFRKES